MSELVFFVFKDSAGKSASYSLDMLTDKTLSNLPDELGVYSAEDVLNKFKDVEKHSITVKPFTGLMHQQLEEKLMERNPTTGGLQRNALKYPKAIFDTVVTAWTLPNPITDFMELPFNMQNTIVGMLTKWCYVEEDLKSFLK